MHIPFAKVSSAPTVAQRATNPELALSTIRALGQKIRSKEVSCVELTEAYLRRIEELDGADGLNSYLTVAADQALASAGALDERLQRGDYIGPLHGIPLAVKDALQTAGVRTTGGTKILSRWVPDKDATVVAALKDAGAVILGKTNLHELGFGITSDNPHYGPVRNPHDHNRIPGGSSGGTGAAVAAGLCAAGLGTDTGGSVRIPAALCGCVGLKPTLGRVSRGGMMGLSWTCDVNGPLARSVADAALMLEVMAQGSNDLEAALPAAAPAIGPFEFNQDADALKGLRVGVPTNYFDEDNDPTIDACMQKVHRLMSENGAELIDVTVPNVAEATEAGFIIVVPEAMRLTAEYLRQADPKLTIETQLHELGPDVQTVFSGEYGPNTQPIPANVYLRALRDTRPTIQRGFTAALEQVDLLLTPSTPTTAVTFDETVEMHHNGRLLETFATFIRYQFCVSLAGLPAISVPAGMSDDGLPIGVQFIGPMWSEQRLINAAWAFEVATSS